ncbi:hypothetical protein O181_020475 [Austropuccinia psidii MF-1]|uniref:Reverse transcriptase Ty1/copia-type domain-containing protein n=1 Tax=Austropuccinia psidii MF-1 TaxID=1389203 RepID=A0A9Q3GW50_9BASI|nr:hypothetical protein [Austropuccinia psidii MF-1]
MLGLANLMLGIEITHEENSITLSQCHYIDALLDLYGMTNCKPVATALIPNTHFEAPSDQEREAFLALNVNYQSAIGSLSYLSTATRPDLCFSVSALSQFLESLGIQHWQAFLHILKYLKGTSTTGLTYYRDNQEPPTAYSDADWGNCRVSRHSVTGYLITIHNNLVIWKMRKQTTVSLSSAEAEYKALTDIACELIWFRQLCKEITINTEDKPIVIHEDSQGCINTENGDCNTSSKQMKHVDMQLHFIREVISSSIIGLIYTPTTSMLADFLTKAVCQPALQKTMNCRRCSWMKDRGDVKMTDFCQSVSS